ncbi:MAG: hypothetical protein KDA61_11820, partial [Planctomycetales bacterium]|nr:hypothetical protein [Planctomycetales bacterium]
FPSTNVDAYRLRSTPGQNQTFHGWTNSSFTGAADLTLEFNATANVTVNNVDPAFLGVSSAAIFENGEATITGSFSDAGQRDEHAIVVHWGDGSSSAATIDQSTRTFTASHTYADDDPSSTGSDVYAVTLSLTDDDLGSATASTTVSVDNVAPIVDAGADQTVSEAVAGTPTELTVVLLNANFTDVGQLDTHSAVIDWGDGVVEPGVVAQGAGSGSVTGSHQYADSGEYVVSVTVTDDDGGAHTDTLVVSVLNAAPTVEIAPLTQDPQYSDSITPLVITASDLASDTMNIATEWSKNGGPFLPGLPDDATLVGGLVLSGDADQVETASWTIEGIADLQPAVYTIRAVVSDEDGGSTPVEATIDVQREDAVATYTGSTFVSTPSVNSGEATVELRATIQDIVAAQPAGADLEPGDITTATVSFIDVSNPSSPVTIASGVPITLLNPADPTSGVAAYSWTADIGNSDSDTFEVLVQVDDNYVGETRELITVSRPIDNAVTGGGYLVNQSSGGQYAGDAGLRTNYGFNIKTNKRGTNVQGHVNLIIRQNDRIYQVKTNATNSLLALPGTDPEVRHAEFIAKANLRDVTDPLNPISLGGNLQLIASVTDAGEPGVNDLVSFTVWDGPVLLYSSHWTGVESIEQLIDGGNIQVRLASDAGTTSNAKTAKVSADDADGFAGLGAGRLSVPQRRGELGSSATIYSEAIESFLGGDDATKGASGTWEGVSEDALDEAFASVGGVA